MKKFLIFSFFILISSCVAQPQATPPSPTLGEGPGVRAIETSTPPPIQTPQTPTPEATPTPEPREYVMPSEGIVFTEGLSKYDLALNPALTEKDLQDIHLDVDVSHLYDLTSKKIPENRVIAEAVLAEMNLTEITHSMDYKLRVEFVKRFLELSGGRAIFTDMNYNRFAVDRNLPTVFEVRQVSGLPERYTRMGNEDHVGGKAMLVDENGQVTYSLALTPGFIDYYINVDQTRKGWGEGTFVSELFASWVNSVGFHFIKTFNLPRASDYRLYLGAKNKEVDVIQPSGWFYVGKVTRSFIVVEK